MRHFASDGDGIYKLVKARAMIAGVKHFSPHTEQNEYAALFHPAIVHNYRHLIRSSLLSSKTIRLFIITPGKDLIPDNLPIPLSHKYL